MTLEEFALRFPGATRGVLIQDGGEVTMYTADCPVCKAVKGLTLYEEGGCIMPDCVKGCSPADIAKAVHVPANGLLWRTMSEIEAKKQKYLFYPYVPSGSYSILAGDSGSTKTWWALYLAALTSKGGKFLTDDPWANARTPRKVIYQTRENDYNTVVRPRLDSLQANLDNIIVLDDMGGETGMSLTLTDMRIETALKIHRPAMVIFDPLQSYLGADVNMQLANEVRPVQDKIIKLSSDYDCAFMIIMHLNKASTMPPVDRILGSTDFKAAARSVCLIGSDPDDPKRRVMVHAKFNGGEYGESIAYRINSQDGVAVEGFCDYTAEQVIGGQFTDRRHQKPSISKDTAIEFLREALGEQGYATLDDIKRGANERGISPPTLHRGKNELYLKSIRAGFSGDMRTWWVCPDIDPEEFKAKMTEPEQQKIS